MSSYVNRFSGIARLYGTAKAQILKNSHVCVIGIGGVGSWTVEALARTGIGEITLIDMDDVCISNVNRQLHALDGTIGKMKIEVMAERAKAINPECIIHCRHEFFTERNAQEILNLPFDCIIDAIDSVQCKCILISLTKRKKIPFVTMGGAGGRTDPSKIEVVDLSRTINDKLAQKIRKKLRQEYNFTKNEKRKFGVPCVFSSELPKYPKPDGTVCDQKPGEGNLRLDCESGYGTSAFVTGTFGFVAASHAIELILKRAAKMDKAGNDLND